MRLLLAEDQRDTADLLAKGLREHAYAVDVVRDGAAALEAAELNDYDLIVLDILLPHVSGLDVCRTLRGQNAHTPILMLTALDAVGDRVAGLDAGADDYLVKPFAPEELLARVRALGRRHASLPAEADVLRVADLELNVRTREATRGGRHVELTAKEFVLLEALMRHAGHVMTRSRLLDIVWNYDVLTDSNVVEMYIHYLRNKVDRDFDQKLIRTVRGVGYAIREPDV